MQTRLNFIRACGQLLLVCLLGCSQASLPASARECQLDNPQLRAMGAAEVQFELASGEVHTLRARLADENSTRAAGFQYVCASVIAAEPILFVFPAALRPSFHMRNVVAPIDIAFVDREGNIDSIQAMQPYSPVMLNKPLYSPKQAVISALETRPGYFAEHGIDLQSRMRWRELDEQDAPPKQ